VTKSSAIRAIIFKMVYKNVLSKERRLAFWLANYQYVKYVEKLDLLSTNSLDCGMQGQ